MKPQLLLLTPLAAIGLFAALHGDDPSVSAVHAPVAMPEDFPAVSQLRPQLPVPAASQQSEPECPVDRGADAPDTAELDLETQLKLGLVDAASYGPGYDAAVRRIASDQVQQIMGSTIENRISDYCGFQTPEALASIANGETELPNYLVQELVALQESASQVAFEVQGYVATAFEYEVGVSTFESGEEPSPTEAPQRSSDLPSGLLTMNISTGVGSQKLVLRFDSRDHPALEAQLQQLQAQKDQFWATARAL